MKHLAQRHKPSAALFFDSQRSQETTTQFGLHIFNCTRSRACEWNKSTGTPIVPIAVTSARCWPRKSYLLRPGMIDVSIGAPIASVGREADELMREVEGWIETEMRRLDPGAYAGAETPAPQPAVAPR